MLSDTARARSAELAALLGQNAAEGGTPARKPTPKGRLLLAALARSPKGAATPDELLARLGDNFTGWTQQAFHETAKTLARNGWIERKRRMVRSQVTGRVQGGPRMYVITDAGRAVLS